MEKRLRRRIGWWLAFGMIGPALTLAPLGGAASRANAASEGEAAARQLQGRIAFASDRDGDFEIYVINADGTGLRQVTRNRRQDFSPSWSPDGKRIAYTSCPGECPLGNPMFIAIDHCADTGIYVTTSDGSRTEKVEDSHRYDFPEYDPEWSPDGRWIAYASGGTCTDGSDVVALNLRNGEERTVAWQDENSTNWHPTWSSDGEQIALNCGYDTVDVCVNPFESGSAPQTVLVGPRDEANPAFLQPWTSCLSG